jgi:hypothetical protein
MTARSCHLDLRCGLSLIACLLLVAPAVQSRPEVIHEGMKYYSNEYFETTRKAG